jgi:hypothetical protein
MAKRSTQVEVTKFMSNGDVVITVNKNKMNVKMCENIVCKLVQEWDESKTKNDDIDSIKFKCIDTS